MLLSLLPLIEHYSETQVAVEREAALRNALNASLSAAAENAQLPMRSHLADLGHGPNLLVAFGHANVIDRSGQAGGPKHQDGPTERASEPAKKAKPEIATPNQIRHCLPSAASLRVW